MPFRFVAPWSKVTCPFCFKAFHLSRAPSRMTAAGAPLERDDKVGAFLNTPGTDMGKVVEPSSGFWNWLGRRFVVTESPDGLRKICPSCHLYLPHKLANGELSSEVFAIIGARSSGKSNFFGVLLNALEKRYAHEVGFTIFDQDTFSVRERKPVSSKRLYRERYASTLFDPDNPAAVKQTLGLGHDKDLRIPLIYRLQFPKQPWDYVTRPFSYGRAIDLAIFDAAGEDLKEGESMEQFCRFIVKATGIIFLIDPLEYPGIRSQLDKGLQRRLTPIDVDASDIVTRVIDLFEKRGGLRSGQKIKAPVAFAFSKCDMLKSLLYPGSALLRDGSHQGGFNVEDNARLSEEVQECIRKWDSPQLVSLAQSNFTNYSFFALSALGELPAEHTLRLSSISPMRVADPLLWLLWKRGYIPAQPKA